MDEAGFDSMEFFLSMRIKKFVRDTKKILGIGCAWALKRSRNPACVTTAGARDREKYPEPKLEEVRKQYGGANLSDEELLLRFYAGPEFVDALKLAPPRKEYLDARRPLVRLVEELSRRKLGHVYIRKGDFSLTIQRGE